MKSTPLAVSLVIALFSITVRGQTPPRPVILAPRNNAHVTTNQIMVSGRTTPNSGVTSVQFSIAGNGPFTAIQLNANNWNNWTAPVQLTAGSNSFVVWANGPGGSSLSNTANYFLVVTSTITVNVSGLGAVVPKLNGKNLVLNQQYTVVAVPDKGQVFAGWSGSVSSSNAKLDFLMQPNMELTASFLPNPFSTNGLPGAYGGLFWEAGSASETNAGLFTMTMDRSGHFTGQVSVDGGVFTIGGEFDAAGATQVTVHRHKKADLTVMLTLDLTGVNGVTGAISSSGENGSGAFVSPLQAYRVGIAGKGYSGKYTVAVSASGSADATVAPQGFTYGTTSVNPAGLANLNLFLSDGSSAIASGRLTSNGFLPLYVSLHRGAGSLLGWISFTNGGPTTNYQIFWFKDPVLNGSFTNGYNLSGLTIWVDPFKVPRHGTNVIGSSNIVVQLAGGDLTGTLSDPLALSAKGAGSGANTDNVRLSFDNNTGIFSGSFEDPIDGQKVLIHGVALESIQSGLGYFLTPDLLSGSVVIMPAP